jgi:hypothetical protein
MRGTQSIAWPDRIAQPGLLYRNADGNQMPPSLAPTCQKLIATTTSPVIR